MTDEIVKALEICNSLSQRCGDGCPYYTVIYKNGKRCSEMMIEDTLDLIKRQQAEIERLHEVINGFEEQSHKELMEYMRLSEKYETARAEAVREFAEMLKKHFSYSNSEEEQLQNLIIRNAIDETLKGMTEE